MTAQTNNKVTVPVGSDGWKLTDHIRGAFESAGLVVPVSSAEERDGLVGKFAGMTVARADLASAPLETYNGTKWSVSDTPWTDLPMAQGFNPVTSGGWSGLKYAVRNGWVIINGAVTRGDPWAAGITCAVLPASIKPVVKVQGNNNAYVDGVNVSLGAGSVAVSFSMTWPLF